MPAVRQKLHLSSCSDFRDRLSWLDTNFRDKPAVERLRAWFLELSGYLEREGLAHGDIQNGNVMVTPVGLRLIDYDGMFVRGLTPGTGTEVGHRHFQHPKRTAADFGPQMDRFSFIAVDLSLRAVLEDASRYERFREGGETIIFKANDFDDPANSEIFNLLSGSSTNREYAQRFVSICKSEINMVPTLADFLAGRNIPARAPLLAEVANHTSSRASAKYMSAYPVVDAADYEHAVHHVGDRVELIGKILEVKPGYGKYGRNKARPYIFINFGPWRGNITKISIWSEGLNRLSDKPSKAWIGKWVSVNGLLDPPYFNKRHGYRHISITVQSDGQIQQLDEGEALYRLDRAAKPTRTGRGIVGTSIDQTKLDSGGLPPGSSPRPPSSGITSKSANQAIVELIKRGAGSAGIQTGAQGTGQTPGSPPQPHKVPRTGGPIPSTPPPPQLLAATRKFLPLLWIGLALLFLYLLSKTGGPLQNQVSSPDPQRPAPGPSLTASGRPSGSPTNTPKPVQLLSPVAVPQPPPAPTSAPGDSEMIRSAEGRPVSSESSPKSTTTRATSEPGVAQNPSELVPGQNAGPQLNPIGRESHVTSPATSLNLAKAADAKQVQERLIVLGFLSGAADGVWGPRSRAALREFKGIQALPATEDWDREAERQLFSELARPAPRLAASPRHRLP